MKGHKNVFQENGIRNQTDVARLISEKIQFKSSKEIYRSLHTD